MWRYKESACLLLFSLSPIKTYAWEFAMRFFVQNFHSTFYWHYMDII